MSEYRDMETRIARTMRAVNRAAALVLLGLCLWLAAALILSGGAA